MIHVKGNYYIDANKDCFVVKEFKGVSAKTGEKMYSNIAYTGTMTHAMEAIIRTIQKDRVSEEDLEIYQVLHEFRRINQEIKEILSQVTETESVGVKND